ncbi:unnamed protein product [Paramecium pentaurelia]|uniref:Cilia- and flagella-associated protein 418 n=1 Tax=Paramecium pentaurelia TaxID=43138 RepID=A0A8S1YB28_9CILI|nr:unnamed protein product [Paramecium pentaurelia]
MINNKFDDDLDELINDINSVMDKPQNKPITSQNYQQQPQTNQSQQQKRKCLQPQIGNQQQFRMCTNLRCLKCDLQVKCHINQKWNKDVDYLIFRNYFNNMSILSKYLIDDNQYNAYNCQCTNVNAHESIAAPQNWVCSGHAI